MPSSQETKKITTSEKKEKPSGSKTKVSAPRASSSKASASSTKATSPFSEEVAYIEGMEKVPSGFHLGKRYGLQ